MTNKKKTTDSYIHYLCANSAHKYNIEYHKIMFNKYKSSVDLFNARKKYIDSLIVKLKRYISLNKLTKSMTIVFDNRWSYGLYRSKYVGELLTDEEVMINLDHKKINLTVYLTKGKTPISKAASIELDIEENEPEKIIQRIVMFVKLIQNRNEESQ